MSGLQYNILIYECKVYWYKKGNQNFPFIDIILWLEAWSCCSVCSYSIYYVTMNCSLPTKLCHTRDAILLSDSDLSSVIQTLSLSSVCQSPFWVQTEGSFIIFFSTYKGEHVLYVLLYLACLTWLDFFQFQPFCLNFIL